MGSKPSPGRPRNASDPQIAKADAAIGRTVWQLAAWGFSLGRKSGGVLDVVAKLAKVHLHRTDAYGLQLSADRIEQIFETWHATATRPNGWATGPREVPFGRPWTLTNVSYLRTTMPHGAADLDDAARRLLLAHGTPWAPSPAPEFLGDPLPTVKGFERIGRGPRMVDDESGVENSD